MLARNHLNKSGHTQAAELHQRAANFHKERKMMLAAQHNVATEAKDSDDAAGGRVLGKKKPDYSAGFPREESTIETWISDLDEGEYSDEVKRASKMAATASEVTKQPHANQTHHETAARMHFIAHGVALAHGHPELAAKHKDMVARHRDQAKQAKAAS